MISGEFYVENDLCKARQCGPQKQPFLHQEVALRELRKWYDSRLDRQTGGILVLPTGGGKTFTATRFACSLPISDGFKVLWLAHTHHLLEQAFAAFETTVDQIIEPKAALNVRLVSGGDGEYFPVHSIRPTDDIVISTLPTMSKAMQQRHESLAAFLATAGDKLLVVFDEAHHAPAATYRQLLRDLRECIPTMVLLGLTATPTYGNERKQGWLLELFPQGIVHQVTASELMQKAILAKPIFHEERTSFSPEFDQREYQKWLGSHRDIPEDIINSLATNNERNDYIVDAYIRNRDKWGKTIIFADRWHQCVALCEKLTQKGVRADAVFAHVDNSLGTVDERNRRPKSANAEVLDRFKRGELDVLVNVKMLTEGTDVPKVQSVYLTRQTTSRVLLTQMIGRALRGPACDGTEEAHIVSFIDDWKQRIDWAKFDQLQAGAADEDDPKKRKYVPLNLISIDTTVRL